LRLDQQNENMGRVLSTPLHPPQGSSTTTSCSVIMRDPDEHPPQEQYICDPSAVLALATLDEDSPQALWAQELAQEGKLYVCFEDMSPTLKSWEPIADSDLATPVVVKMLARMTGVTVDGDESLYDSVVAFLHAHSAKHESPRALRRLVTNSYQPFWEVFFGTEEKREKTRWAVLTVGGGRRLIDNVKLWELD
jgi:hypothetical protein